MSWVQIICHIFRYQNNYEDMELQKDKFIYMVSTREYVHISLITFTIKEHTHISLTLQLEIMLISHYLYNYRIYSYLITFTTKEHVYISLPLQLENMFISHYLYNQRTCSYLISFTTREHVHISLPLQLENMFISHLYNCRVCKHIIEYMQLRSES